MLVFPKNRKMEKENVEGKSEKVSLSKKNLSVVEIPKHKYLIFISYINI